MSTQENLIVIRTYEEPIPLPTPEVRQSTGIELIEVSVEANNGNTNGHSVFHDNINSHVLSDKSTKTSGKSSKSESTPLSSNESNVNPVVIDKSNSSVGASNPASIPSNTKGTSRAFKITIPPPPLPPTSVKSTTTNSFWKQKMSLKYSYEWYVIACTLSTLIIGIAFYLVDESYSFLGISVCFAYYLFPSVCLFKKFENNNKVAIRTFIIITLILIFILCTTKSKSFIHTLLFGIGTIVFLACWQLILFICCCVFTLSLPTIITFFIAILIAFLFAYLVVFKD